MLVKTDSYGTLLWIKHYDIGYSSVAYSVVQTSDGGYALAGTKVWKTDSAGVLQWSQPLYDPWALNAYSIIQTSDGGYAYAGDGGSPSWPGNYLAKTDSSGIKQWNVSTAASILNHYNVFCSVVQTSDGGYAVTGSTSSFGHGKLDVDLLKTDSSGVVEWEQYYGGSQNDEAYCLIETSDGGLALAGYTNSSFPYDMWLIKLSPSLPSTYSATIWAWENVTGWLAEPIQMDGASTGYSTPYNFTGLTGTHTFTVPNTDVRGYPFKNWTTGETSTTITVSADGTYTAQYYTLPSVTIWAWDNATGWLPEPITMDGNPTGFSTPYSFTGLTGAHTFTVPNMDVHGNLFGNWTTGEMNPTITVSSNGTYTAQYYATYGIPEFPAAVVLPLATASLSLIAVKLKKTPKPR